MSSKVHVGPHGGKYVVRKGKKVYLKKKGVARVVKGRGAYSRATRTFGPSARTVKGKGNFIDTVKGVLEAPFETAGKALGAITGLGAYSMGGMTFVKNSLLGMETGGTNAGVLPEVANKSRRFIVTHKEFLGDVASAGAAFTLNGFKINPGLTETFPWLSNIAVNFEQWAPLGIVFQYKTTSVDALNSLNTSLGSVILATDYNSANPDFSSKEQMDNTSYVSSTKPSCSVLHPIECSPKETPTKLLYVRQGGIGSGQDPRLYDLGNFQIATVGQQAGTDNIIGELWVSYQIEFFKPILTDVGLGAPQFAHWLRADVGAGGFDKDNLFEDMKQVFNNTSIQIETPNGTGGTIFDLTPVPGSRFIAQVLYAGDTSPGAVVNPPSVTLTGVSPAPLWEDQTNDIAPSIALDPDTATSSSLLFQVAFDVDAVGTPWTISWADDGTLPSSGTGGGAVDLIVMQIAVEQPLTPSPEEVAKMGPITRAKYLKKQGLIKKPKEKPVQLSAALLDMVGNQQKLDELLVEDMVSRNPGMTKLTAYASLLEAREEKKAEQVAKDAKERPGIRKRSLKKSKEEKPVLKAEEPKSAQGDDFVDLSASQLLVKAIEKAAKK